MAKVGINLVVAQKVKKDKSILLVELLLAPVKKEEEENLGAKKPQKEKSNEKNKN